MRGTSEPFDSRRTRNALMLLGSRLLFRCTTTSRSTTSACVLRPWRLASSSTSLSRATRWMICRLASCTSLKAGLAPQRPPASERWNRPGGSPTLPGPPRVPVDRTCRFGEACGHLGLDPSAVVYGLACERVTVEGMGYLGRGSVVEAHRPVVVEERNLAPSCPMIKSVDVAHRAAVRGWLRDRWEAQESQGSVWAHMQGRGRLISLPRPSTRSPVHTERRPSRLTRARRPPAA